MSTDYNMYIHESVFMSVRKVKDGPDISTLMYGKIYFVKIFSSFTIYLSQN